MTTEQLNGWAETTVYPSFEGGKDSPEDGDQCPICKDALTEGEQVFRVIEPVGEGKWVHGSHVWKETIDD